jgi:hypothetical protein
MLGTWAEAVERSATIAAIKLARTLNECDMVARLFGRSKLS